MYNTTIPMPEDTSVPVENDGNEYTSAMIYGYGTISVAIISCLALLGVILFPVLNNRAHEYCMQFVIALGVGTMAADALVHIIPDALGIHSDEEGSGSEEHAIIVWKMSVVYAGIYFLYFFENALRTWRRNRSPRRIENIENRNLNEEVSSSRGHSPRVPDADVYENKAAVSENDPQDNNIVGITDSFTEEEQTVDEVFPGCSTVVLSVFVGDALHNVADGVAIGVSFASSSTAGIGTSIAVLCHEVPHELGDFAIYLKNGTSKWRAIGLNVAAACCAFVGLYVGIAASKEESVRQWMLAPIAGIFLYIALVQVMVEMVRPTSISPGIQFLLQNLGLIVGWILMLMLGLYEEAIQESLV